MEFHVEWTLLLPVIICSLITLTLHCTYFVLPFTPRDPRFEYDEFGGGLESV